MPSLFYLMDVVIKVVVFCVQVWNGDEIYEIKPVLHCGQ